MTARRVLITGAGGFVGSHLAEGFRRSGAEVTALDLRFDASAASRLMTCRLVEAAVDRPVLAGLDERYDLVVHAAAITASPAASGETDAAQIQRNLDPLLAALDFAERTRPSAFVFVSSSGVFSSSDASDLLLETTPATGSSAYAVAKRVGEQLVAAAGRHLRTLSVRLGYIYGPHEQARTTRPDVSLVRRWLDLVETGRPVSVATPDLRRDWTFAGDLAGALDRALALSPAQPLVHLGSGQIVRDQELAEQLVAVAGRGRIERPATPHPHAGKAPMGSIHALGAKWTPLVEGLRMTCAELVPA